MAVVLSCLEPGHSALPLQILTDLEMGGGLTGTYATILLRVQLTAYIFYKYNYDRIIRAYDKLSDEESKYEYKKYFQNMFEGNMLFSLIRNDAQYWGNDIISAFNNGDVLLNAGAYDGADLDRALAINPNIIIHAVEPNKESADKLKIKYKGMDNVNIHEYGLGDKSETSYFDGKGVGGKRLKEPESDTNSETIKIEPLDNIINTPINYIALDIEGDELLALKGARRVINKYKPVLAVSTYHKIPHIVEVMETIEDICPGYAFYFRHYSSILTESVLYAKYIG